MKAVNGFDTNCNEEAVRVIQNAPAFLPGKQRGKAIKERMEIPVIFTLDRSNNNEDASPKGIIVIKEVESITRKLEVEASYRHDEWSGTVYDEEGNVLPGANIVVSGTATGTVSDLDGTFKVKADQTKNLVTSFVG